MLKPLLCPVCKGQIDHFDEDAQAGMCPYCRTTIVNVRERQHEFALNSQGALKVTEADFEIKGGALFKYHGEDRKVIIPDGVVAVKSGAFAGMSGILEVVFPDSVEELDGDSGAFSGCTRLQSVTLSRNLRNIGDHAFSKCIALKEVALPDSVIWIGLEAFAGCASLREIAIPGSVQIIGHRAFYDCEQLQNVRLSEGLREINSLAFFGCKSLQEIQIPLSLRMVHSNAFYAGRPRGTYTSLRAIYFKTAESLEKHRSALISEYEAERERIDNEIQRLKRQKETSDILDFSGRKKDAAEIAALKDELGNLPNYYPQFYIRP